MSDDENRKRRDSACDERKLRRRLGHRGALLAASLAGFSLLTSMPAMAQSDEDEDRPEAVFVNFYGAAPLPREELKFELKVSVTIAAVTEKDDGTVEVALEVPSEEMGGVNPDFGSKVFMPYIDLEAPIRECDDKYCYADLRVSAEDLEDVFDVSVSVYPDFGL